MRTALSLTLPALCIGCLTSAAVPEPTASEPTAASRPADPEGCPASVSDLPNAWYLGRGDYRLRSENLIVVLKSKRKIALFSDGKLRHAGPNGEASCWDISLGARRTAVYGTKQVKGDRRTPEGWYRVSDKPRSSFYAAIAIHYPNETDANRGFQAGHLSKREHATIVAASRAGILPPQATSLGGDVLIHGGGSGSDWTAGCVAMADKDIDRMRVQMYERVETWTLILP